MINCRPTTRVPKGLRQGYPKAYDKGTQRIKIYPWYLGTIIKSFVTDIYKKHVDPSQSDELMVIIVAFDQFSRKISTCIVHVAYFQNQAEKSTGKIQKKYSFFYFLRVGMYAKV